MDEKPPNALRSRAISFLKSHPVLALFLLTPGIPEYLSSSSPINAIILNPPLFLFQLLANLGLYGSGALLIHDARIRWGRGWSTVLLLGAAYGILEEGVALSTLFNPKAGPVGSLGSYGHWLGVNWIWSAGIVPFHAIFSISLPILLLGLAIPETRNKPLLSGRRMTVTFVVLALDVAFLMFVVWHASGYWMGWPILILSLLSIGALVWASRRAPPGLLATRGVTPYASTLRLALVGVSFFPAVILTQSIGMGAEVPAAADFFLVILVQALYLAYIARKDWRDSVRGVIALTAGLLVPIAIFGVIAELAFPLTLLVDVALAAFLRGLWIKFSSHGGAPQFAGRLSKAPQPASDGLPAA
jgi:hypothetical protein